ncbi:MAG: COG4705 family protein [Oryzihumus sp.]
MSTTTAAAEKSRTALSTVPEVTVLFWVAKVLTTGMGETASDFLAHHLDPVVAGGLGAVGLVAALALQLRARRYVPWVYWLAVAMVSVFGTMAADVVHVILGIPYAVSTVAFLLTLAAVFAVWRRTEGTLSIHSITTRRRELFYWTTVLTTFALGTAAGDLTATTLHLGYLASGVLFAVVIAVPAVAHWKLGLGAVSAFWFAYIVTRPLGESFADWMGVPASRRGLGWGTGPVTLALAVLIVGVVGYLAATHVDAPVAQVGDRDTAGA